MGPFRDEYGAGSSPILFDGKVILNQDHDIDSFLLALDSASGKMVWRVARPDAVRSYSTPVIRTNAEGHAEILVAGALQLRLFAAHSQHQLRVISDRQSTRRLTSVLQRDANKLDRLVRRD